MKYVLVYTFSLISLFYTSCGQRQANVPKDNIKSETKDIVTSPGSNEKYSTKHEYTDSIGKRLIIQNSFPRGGRTLTLMGRNILKFILDSINQ